MSWCWSARPASRACRRTWLPRCRRRRRRGDGGRGGTARCAARGAGDRRDGLRRPAGGAGDLRRRHRRHGGAGLPAAHRCRLREAVADQAPLHGDVPAVPGTVRRRQPGADRAAGHRRRHLHRGLLRHAEAGHRRGVLHRRRGPGRSALDLHAECAVHRDRRGRVRWRQRDTGRFRAERPSVWKRCARIS